MPTCIVRYSFTTTRQSNLENPSPGCCVGTAEEVREQDEWGDPGKLVSRYWIKVVAENGQDITHRVNQGYYRLDDLEVIGAVEWEGADA